jgi:hypothetical protein
MERPARATRFRIIAAWGTAFLEFTFGRSPSKHGRFTAAMHIPIHPVDAIDMAKPDYTSVSEI